MAALGELAAFALLELAVPPEVRWVFVVAPSAPPGGAVPVGLDAVPDWPSPAELADPACGETGVAPTPLPTPDEPALPAIAEPDEAVAAPGPVALASEGGDPEAFVVGAVAAASTGLRCAGSEPPEMGLRAPLLLRRFPTFGFSLLPLGNEKPVRVIAGPVDGAPRGISATGSTGCFKRLESAFTGGLQSLKATT